MADAVVDILLATYNGAKYLSEQVQSLQQQTHTNWRLWVRDDGSSDNTIEVLNLLAATDGRIHLLSADGLRLGAKGSFSRLLATAPTDGQYFMFCDQDDVWLPEKIAKSLARIQQEEKLHPNLPVLVHSDLIVANSDMTIRHASFFNYAQLSPERTRFQDLLLQNNVTGCTMMLNAPLRQLCIDPLPKAAIMHDWWIALLATAFGHICVLQEPMMYYRQHESNTIGAKKMSLWVAGRELFSIRLTLHDSRNKLIRTQLQASAFFSMYRHRFNPAQIYVLQHYSNLMQKHPILRRYWLLRLNMHKSGFLRNAGLFMAI